MCAFGYATPDDRIVVVGIDDDALSDDKGFGKRLTEWDRTIYARLIQHLQHAGARVIIFDILFAGQNDQGDANLATALDEFPAVILNVIESSQEFQYPTPRLAHSGAHLGLANVLVDSDHVVRRIPLHAAGNGASFETLAVQVARLYWRLPAALPMTLDGQQVTLPNGLRMAVDMNENLVLHYARANQYIPSQCSISRVLGNAANEFKTAAAQQNSIEMPTDLETCPETMFRDKIVFVGATAIATGDVHATPVGQMFGVEIHANATATLLRGAALQEQSHSARRFVIISLALLLGLMGMLRKPFTLVVTVVLGTLCALILAILAYPIGNLRMDTAGPLLTFGIVGPTVLVLQNLVQRRERGEIITLLSMQISQNVSRQLLQAYDRNELVLGGELRQVSVVFIDMRDYTTLAETLAPERVMHIVNTYLGIIAEQLIKYDGTLSQYVGDQAMAIFNAPMEQADHAQRAVTATAAALEAVAAYNRSLCAEYEANGRIGAPPLLANFGAGINTGDAVAGNIGTSERYNYTVIGDIVNVAARLCNAAPPGAIYLGPATHSALLTCTDFIGRTHEVGPISLKGKAEPMPVYSIQLTDNEPIASASGTSKSESSS
ncbi:MAG: adenylate/guanylate cyclase domain-containing protein [Caldilineaceae bacterium]